MAEEIMPVNVGMLLGMIKSQDKRLKQLEEQIKTLEEKEDKFIVTKNSDGSGAVGYKGHYQKQVRDENSRTSEESQG